MTDNNQINKQTICRCCGKNTILNEDTDECKECGKYKLYSYVDPDGFDWWIKNMDNDYVIDDDEFITFRARINNDNDSNYSVLEWYYGITPDKKFNKNISGNGNSVFWQEFCQTYCRCYDDDEDY